MGTVTSKDGTTIAFDKTGSGPAVIVVNGALGYRDFSGDRELADALSGSFSVYIYDRRGRGESTDTPPYSVQREVEDIEALIDHAGGSAYLYGVSSGAVLAMEAAIVLGSPKVTKIAMYEAPYNAEAGSRQRWREFRKQLDETLAAGRNGDAVGLFMMLVGASAEDVESVRQMPIWPAMEAVAPTLAYDTTVLGEEADVPMERAGLARVPALVMDGGASFPFMHETAVTLANAMPQGQQRTLEGQTHEVQAAALAPVLIEFFRE